MSEPTIDAVHVTTDAEDGDEVGGNPIPFRSLLAELGIDPDDLDDDQRTGEPGAAGVVQGD